MTGLPYHSGSTFLGVPPQAEGRPFGLAGLPWDGAVTNRPGARFGPRAIRDASRMLCDGTHPLFDVSPAPHLQDHGDLPIPAGGVPAMQAALAPRLERLVAAHHMVWLGGDHSVTLPLLRAYRRHLGRPVALVHFDAHCDTWPDHFGEPSGHGTWVREAIEEGLVRADCVVQIGLRSAAERAAREFVRDRGGLVFEARALRGLDGADRLAPVLREVRARLAAAGAPPVYLSLDIDCLDPAFAPGTGTPEPAGLTSTQLMTFLEEWADLPWVGMDCVEVAPAYDHAELTAYAAAQCVWTYLSGRVAARCASHSA